MGNPKKMTALVTGASAGLGAAFARHLAQDHHVILVARKAEALSAVQKEIIANGGSAEIFPADLATPEGIRNLTDHMTRDRESLALVVNNAGFGNYGRFHEIDAAAEQLQIALNVQALVAITHAALGIFVPKRQGGIINVASVAGFQPTPYSATYSATKAFVKSFTQAIAVENRDLGIRIQVLCPGFTHTEFQQRAGIPTSGIPGFMWMFAEDVVRISLEKLGSETVCVPGLVNQAMTGISGFVPGGISAEIAALVTKKYLGGK